MKTHSLLPSEFSLAADCLNLRPSLQHDRTLVPVGKPKALYDTPWQCVLVQTHNDGKITELLTHAGILAACTHGPDDDSPEPYIVTDNLADRITDAIISPNGFTVLTEGLPVELEWEDGLLRAVKQCGVNDFPAIHSVTVDETSLPCRTGALKLSHAYTSLPEYPDPTDALKLSAHVASVCENMADRATFSGVFTAPVLFRYRLVSADGRVLFTSVPTMHQPSGRHAPTAPLRLALNGTELAPADIAIEGYGIEVTVPAEASAIVRRLVARVELQLSPQLHTSLADTLIVSQVRKYGNDTAVEITSPGYGGHPLLMSRITDILANPDDNFVTVLTLHNPLSPTAVQTVTLTPLLTRIADEKTVAPRKNGDTLLPLLAYHDWGATVGINDGARRLLADIHLSRYRGASAPHFINTGSSLDNIETAVTVTFDNGEKITSTRYLRGPREVALSPVLCYPDPSAVMMEIQLCDSDGVNRYASFPLSRVSSSMAAYIDPSLRPVELRHNDDSPEFLIPVSSGATRRLAGTIVCVDSAGPLSTADCGNSNIVAIHPASRASTSAWEASRSRFHIMADNGIYALSLNAGIMQSPRLLDRRPVRRGDAVASLSTAAGNRLYALAGGDLVLIENDRTVTVRHGVAADMLGPVTRHQELLLIPGLPATYTTGTVTATVLHLGKIPGWSTRTLPAVSRVYSDNLITCITAVDGLYTTDHVTADHVSCHYRRAISQQITHPLSGVARLPYITVDLESSAALGDITVTGSHGHGNETVLSRLTVDGPLYRPLCHHLLAPPRYRLWLMLDIQLSTDSTLHLND